MKRAIGYGAAMFAVAVAVGVVLMRWRYDLPLERRAVTVGLQVAFFVQMVAFAIARAGMQRNLVAAWGAGALLRFVALVGWGLVAALMLRWPPEPALVSAALALVLGTMIEPLFLKTTR